MVNCVRILSVLCAVDSIFSLSVRGKFKMIIWNTSHQTSFYQPIDTTEIVLSEAINDVNEKKLRIWKKTELISTNAQNITARKSTA